MTATTLRSPIEPGTLDKPDPSGQRVLRDLHGASRLQPAGAIDVAPSDPW
jgi:hypothetical protein